MRWMIPQICAFNLQFCAPIALEVLLTLMRQPPTGSFAIIDLPQMIPSGFSWAGLSADVYWCLSISPLAPLIVSICLVSCPAIANRHSSLPGHVQSCICHVQTLNTPSHLPARISWFPITGPLRKPRRLNPVFGICEFSLTDRMPPWHYAAGHNARQDI